MNGISNSLTEDDSTLKDLISSSVQLKTIELRVVAGLDTGLRKDFCQPYVKVGTAADNDLILTDRSVSRHHLELRVAMEGVVLRDLWSSNGTFINFRRVTQVYPEPETLCDIGNSRLLIRYTLRASEQHGLGGLVGASPPMRELYSLIQLAAPHQATVLLQGESGSGKEQVARTLHELSGRNGSFVVCDVSSKGSQIIHDDLFGHVKGAYTGATEARNGAFREAHLGTLLIDEIGELPLELQPLLLRALEKREITPLGADRAVSVDVRVIAATHRDLWTMVQAGQFRADLFYRLWVFPLKVPALRETRDDIPLLAKHLLARMSFPYRVSLDAIDRLKQHHWPGNVRELRNVLERAAMVCQGGEIFPEHLVLLPSSSAASTVSQGSPHPIPCGSPHHPTIEEVERKLILDTWDRNNHTLETTARELGISVSTLKRRLKTFP